MAWWSWLLVFSFAFASEALAQKTNEPIYEDPFDIGAGGASLTRASKEGIVLANPALLGLGGAHLRWLGETTTLLANKESVSTAEGLIKNAKGNNGAGSNANQQQASTLEQDVFKNPVHVGWGEALGFVSSAVGITAFSRFEPDIRAQQYGPTGLPDIEFRSESYQGAAVGIPIYTPARWLTLGITGKYIYANEQDVVVDVTDQAAIQSFASPQFVQSLKDQNQGFGYDAGSVMFFQGSNVDLTAAGKVDDIGDTKLSGPAAEPKSFKQVISAGLGLTFHDSADAIHFAADYRDIANVYHQDMFKRVYAGTKILIRTYLGLSAGFYNGAPSMGAEVDLIFIRLAVTSYTRELGDHPGVDPRHVLMASLSMGF